MNASELVSRLCIVEQKIEKLFMSDSLYTPSSGFFKLSGITTVERVALTLELTTAGITTPIVVYDINDQTFYAWNGVSWV